MTAAGARRTPYLPVWAFVALFWLLLAVIYASQMALVAPRPPVRIFRTQLTWQSVYYLLWVPFTLLIWRVTRDWEIERLGWPRLLAMHVAFAVAVAVTHASLLVAIALSLLPPNAEPLSMIWFGSVRGRLHLQMLIYAAIVGTGQAFKFHNQYREGQLASARLEAQLSAARLDTLRAQLQPHFLFNSLHSIASLARAGDTAGVVRLISGFSELLRHLLDSRITHHALRDELALVDRYLDIQRVRFGDRLSVSIDATPEAHAARVPLLIVQPLVENALRHGFAPRVEPGHLAVTARRDGASLVIEVRDDGVGLPGGSAATEGPGTGLRNLRFRLREEYGDRQSLAVAPAAGGGVQVTLSLPYSRA